MAQEFVVGPRNALSDVAGLRVGNADADCLKSGVTVVVSEDQFTAGVHVMGGAPGTRETDLLSPDKTVQKVDALVLSGGSAFGLDAASGIADGLRSQNRGFAVGPVRVPIVPSAILFDLANGGDKSWAVNPYKELGMAALAAASSDFEIGSVGAGTGAITANLKGGLGTASFKFPNGVTVGALVAVNSLGSVTVDDGPHFWAAPFEMAGEFGDLGSAPKNFANRIPHTKSHQPANTTIGIVATDAELSQAQCTRLATAAHDGIARAIVPAHTPLDGDLLFAAATGAKPLADPVSDTLLLGHAASLCVSRAIARAVFEATPADGDLKPAWSARFGGAA